MRKEKKPLAWLGSQIHKTDLLSLICTIVSPSIVMLKGAAKIVTVHQL